MPSGTSKINNSEGTVRSVPKTAVPIIKMTRAAMIPRIIPMKIKISPIFASVLKPSNSSRVINCYSSAIRLSKTRRTLSFPGVAEW
jgi:hypothetical protein